jgi:hypothetical protein
MHRLAATPTLFRFNRNKLGFLTAFCAFMFLLFIFCVINDKAIGYNHLPLNFSSDHGNCTTSLLQLDFQNSVCLIDQQVFVKLCQGFPLFTSCVLISDVDFNIICKNLPYFIHNAQSRSDEASSGWNSSA